MIHLFIVLAAVAIALLVFGYVARAHRAPGSLQRAEGALATLDVQAFSRLFDRADEAFLRERLSKKAYGEVARARRRACLSYLKALDQAASALLTAGQDGARDPDPVIASASQKLLGTALAFRRSVWSLRLRIWASQLRPGLLPAAPEVVSQYQVLRQCVADIAASQHAS